MKLSIVIVSWNTRKLLRACLNSILRGCGDGFDFEILAVDNASSDGSAEMIRRDFPEVRLFQLPENIGFARANNHAVREARGQYVLLLNPDTKVGTGAIRRLVDFMEQRPKAGAVGPRVLNPDGSLQTSCYPSPTLFREFWRLFHLDRIKPLALYEMEEWDCDLSRQVEVLQGACLLVRGAAFRESGLLDEDYFIYSEDVDLCRRLREAGWTLHWEPGATVLHYGAQSTTQVEDPMFLRLYEGKVAYFRKHHGPGSAAVYKVILLMASLSRQILGPIAMLKRSSRRRRDLSLARRYRLLVRALPHL